MKAEVSERWVPVRAGIHNIWEYDRQVFEFAGGRLVLRGPNGSGKSNALALILPFLFDGVMSASRMDSMSGGKGGRSMKSLLLCLADDDRLAKQYRHDQRTGYVWLEFQKAGEYLAIGVGARASKSRDAEAWFFVTGRRPEIDFELVVHGIPCTRGQLTEALGPNEVLGSVDAYRSAVDHALFGIGPQRYRNLIEQLTVLRRPHLAGRLDLERLSGALSDGLIALDPQLLADVAASFEDLQAVQQDLKKLEGALRSVEAFVPVYRSYLEAAARTRGRTSGEARRVLKSGKARLATAKKAASEADLAAGLIAGEITECSGRLAAAESRLRAVLESPAYRDSSRLAELRQTARNSSRSADQAAERLGHAEIEVSSNQTKLQKCIERAGEATARFTTQVKATIESADQSGIAWTVSPEGMDKPDLESALRGSASGRRAQVVQVRQALDASERARNRAEQAREAVQACDEELDLATIRRAEAAARVDQRETELTAQIRSWGQSSRVEGLELLAEHVHMVGEPDSPSLGELLKATLAPSRETLATRDSRLEERGQSLGQERLQVGLERQRVATEPVPSPRPPETRRADRSSRLGAPLFACTNFAPGLSGPERAGIEAALESSGLLDAWIGDQNSDFDSWLAPGPAAPGPTLAGVLIPTPSPESGLAPAQIVQSLQTVALEGTGISVNTRGEFAFGTFLGRFGKDHAEYVGAEAREELRLRRLAELDASLAGLSDLISQVSRDRETVARERMHLAKVESALPPSGSVVEAKGLHLSAIAGAAAAQAATTRAAAALSREAEAARLAAEQLHTTATGFRLPTSSYGLTDFEHLIHLFEQQASKLLQDRSARDNESRQVADAQVARDAAGERAARGRSEHDEMIAIAADLQARVGQLTDLLGSDADAPIRLKEAVQLELNALKIDQTRLYQAQNEAAEHRGSTRQTVEDAAAALVGLEKALETADARLIVIGRPEIWAVIRPSQPRPADLEDIAAECARLPGAAEPDGNTVQRAHQTLMYEIGQSYESGLWWIDEVAQVQVTSETGTYPVAWLHTQLEEQVRQQKDLLSERDREIFERHLLSRISEALRDLLNETTDLVGRINRSLGERPTASGKRVSLRWELESDDPATRQALELLRRSPEHRGPDQNDQLRTFFANRIEQMRAEVPEAGYFEVLASVLDYRSWHRFALSIVSAGGGTQRLTKTLFKSLSGGEQAVVLHLPMFAAVSAHYEAAQASAPHLVALDEAFAGIDEGMRADLMGLMVQFDLDLILTGHEIWGAYEQVPALMVYDLLRQPPLEGVSAFGLLWNGRTLQPV